MGNTNVCCPIPWDVSHRNDIPMDKPDICSSFSFEAGACRGAGERGDGPGHPKSEIKKLNATKTEEVAHKEM